MMKTPYWIKQLFWVKAFFSPFKRPKIKFYRGKIKYGTPYFYPRKWVKGNSKLIHEAVLKHIEKEENYNKLNPKFARTIKPYNKLYEEKKGYSYAVPKKIGFDFVNLGWKTKWTDIDFRFEWGPMWSFVFFKWQFCVFFMVPEPDHYWTSWLYYELNTDKSKTPKERIEECKKGFPNIWKGWEGDKEILIDYYPVILK